MLNTEDFKYFDTTGVWVLKDIIVVDTIWVFMAFKNLHT
jgi:hypothetical protein